MFHVRCKLSSWSMIQLFDKAGQLQISAVCMMNSIYVWLYFALKFVEMQKQRIF